MVAAPVQSEVDGVPKGTHGERVGSSERAIELFELAEPTDDQIRDEVAWQAAIGGRLSISCTKQATPGVFTRHAPYHNAITDAVNLRDRGDTFRVVVNDGVIREFSFPEHSGLMAPLAAFVSGIENNQACDHPDLLVLARTADCANLILEHLDEFAADYETNT